MKNNSLRIKKAELIELIRKSILKYANQLGNREVSKHPLMICGKINFEKPVFRGFRDYEYINKKIDEGLITTYPVNSVENILIRRFGISKEQIDRQEIDDGGETIIILNVMLPPSATKDDISKIKSVMRTCGYSSMNNFEIINGVGVLSFEPLYHKDVSRYIKQHYKYLYHQTPTVLVPKILKKGITPHAKNTIFLYPERVYCMKGDKLSTMQMLNLRAIQKARNEKNPQIKNPNDKLKYSVLTISVEKLPKDIKMYTDPVSDEAIYTYEPIPPSAITSVDDLTF